MPTYTYRCHACDAESADDYPIGTARRVKKCECGKIARLVIGAGVMISAAATPTSRGNVIAIDRREKQFEQDAPAYKRMRHRGLQPDRIDGSAKLENEVSDQFDIDHGRALRAAGRSGGGGRERVREAVESIEVTHSGT